MLVFYCSTSAFGLDPREIEKMGPRDNSALLDVSKGHRPNGGEHGGKRKIKQPANYFI